MNILSLDLEGVLVVDANAFVNPEEYIKAGGEDIIYPRKHTQYFLHEIENYFDKIYLNTWVYDDIANKVMRSLNFSKYEYLYVNTLVSKVMCFETLSKNNHIIHIEDGLDDYDLAKKLGIDFIEVEEYLEFSNIDDELLRVCSEMKRLLSNK